MHLLTVSRNPSTKRREYGMKKEYVAPEVKWVKFELQDTIADNPGGDIQASTGGAWETGETEGYQNP